MRIFAISDIHIDYRENREWLYHLSQSDYKQDILILAGDISDMPSLIEETFIILKKRFAEVLYVPGNHDLWVRRHKGKNSLVKFHQIAKLAANRGITMKPAHFGSVSVVPLFGWYDYSFGFPSDDIKRRWADYTYCKWPDNFDEPRITRYFTSMNERFLTIRNKTIISFSHFLPRIDLMPYYIPPQKRKLYPVLGTSIIEKQIRKLGSRFHIYGHSHVSRRVSKGNILYINNAFGYPRETRISSKELYCVIEMQNN